MGNVGQIALYAANICNQDEVAAVLDGTSAVINLVGLLAQKGAQTFRAVHEDAVEKLAQLCVKAKVENVVHVSALGADMDAKSLYAASKARGEKKLLTHVPHAVILRPSVMVGAQDDFFNRFARMALISPFIPLIGGGHNLLQPLDVADAAQAVVMGLKNKDMRGKCYELGGPECFPLRDLIKMMLQIIKRERLCLSLPFFVANLLAATTQWLPNPPITTDQIKLLKLDNIVSQHAIQTRQTLQGLGLTPNPIQSVVAGYLQAYKKQ